MASRFVRFATPTFVAFHLGIDLGQAIMETWNQKASDLGIPMAIDAEDWHYTRSLTEEEKERVGLK